MGKEREGGGEHRARCDRAAVAVLDLVAKERQVPRDMLLHRSRCRAAVADSRHLAMYLVHTALGRSLTEVGLLFGRDRTTVAYACARIEDRRDRPSFDAEVERLEQVIAKTEGGVGE